MAKQVRLTELLHFTDRQWEAAQKTDAIRHVLYGGARGGGKSYWIRWNVVRKLFRWTGQDHFHLNALVACNTFPDVRMRQWNPALYEFPTWLGDFKHSTFDFIFKERYGGHRISFRNLDDPQKYKSGEYAIVAPDELTLIPARETMDHLRGVLRAPGVTDTRFFAGSNPDGPGHSWVKRMFVEKDFSRPEDRRLRPEDFAFIRSLPTDNPYLDDAYIREILESLPESLRKPWLEGSWDLFEGQRFKFVKGIHTCKSYEYEEKFGKIDWDQAVIIRTMDFGFQNPYACLWIAVMPNSHRPDKPDIIVYRERNRGGLRSREVAEDVKANQPWPWEQNPAITYLDNQCWVEMDEGLSIADKLMAHGIDRLTQVLKDRVAGWFAVDELLYYKHSPESLLLKETTPRVIIFEDTCPFLVEQLQDAVWHPKKNGDIDHPEGFRDDSLDAFRYFCLTHFYNPNRPDEYDHDAHQRRIYEIMSMYGTAA